MTPKQIANLADAIAGALRKDLAALPEGFTFPFWEAFATELEQLAADARDGSEAAVHALEAKLQCIMDDPRFEAFRRSLDDPDDLGR